ncbi:hypothetical protein EHQ58_01810 [Leptospira ognonensis]|uniref:Porin n=1 Tax=Leptospira ognonensis TaxID=2484945 RepID=A0A4R9K8R7_9LEPT|nr:hypothetical protein [Leptospira ognonensis]TGL63028.1 hypothetical protein EHQ58_01810 [Leptospira ognonensis]
MSRRIVLYFLPVFLATSGITSALQATPWEIGLRSGLGYRVPGRFDSNLSNFSSSFSPAVLSDVTLSGGDQTATYEGLVRVLLDPNSKIGIAIGRQDLSKLALTEISSDSYLTKLQSDIFSYHLIGTYHFVTELSRNWEWENGLGMGFTSADWQIRGFSVGGTDSLSFFQQRGNLRGNGLVYRAESSINRRLGDNNYFQIGLGYHHIAISNFSGNYNGETSSVYLSTNGKVGVFDDSRVFDVNVSTSQFLRQLDMNAGSWNLYFSVMHRFLD